MSKLSHLVISAIVLSTILIQLFKTNDLSTSTTVVAEQRQLQNSNEPTPLKATKSLLLTSIQPSRLMNNQERHTLEGILFQFLNEQFMNKNTVPSIGIKTTRVHVSAMSLSFSHDNHHHHDHHRDGHYLNEQEEQEEQQQQMKKIAELNCQIIFEGEYYPPPFYSYSTIIEETVLHYSDALLYKIHKHGGGGDYFKYVSEIKMEDVSSEVIAEWHEPPQQQQNEEEKITKEVKRADHHHHHDNKRKDKKVISDVTSSGVPLQSSGGEGEREVSPRYSDNTIKVESEEEKKSKIENDNDETQQQQQQNTDAGSFVLPDPVYTGDAHNKKVSNHEADFIFSPAAGYYDEENSKLKNNGYYPKLHEPNRNGDLLHHHHDLHPPQRTHQTNKGVLVVANKSPTSRILLIRNISIIIVCCLLALLLVGHAALKQKKHRQEKRKRKMEVAKQTYDMLNYLRADRSSSSSGRWRSSSSSSVDRMMVNHNSLDGSNGITRSTSTRSALRLQRIIEKEEEEQKMLAEEGVVGSRRNSYDGRY